MPATPRFSPPDVTPAELANALRMLAADAVGTGRDLARGLRRLSADTLSNLTPHPWYVALHYSHPPVVERVRALEAGDRSPFDPQLDRCTLDTAVAERPASTGV